MSRRPWVYRSQSWKLHDKVFGNGGAADGLACGRGAAVPLVPRALAGQVLVVDDEHGPAKVSVAEFKRRYPQYARFNFGVVQ